MSLPPSQQRMRAFSLPELLVALVVGVVLLTILFPAGREVYRASREAACANTLRGYGTAIFALIGDLGAYPPAPIADINFSDTLTPTYLNEVPNCPLANAKERKEKKSFFYAGNAPLVFYFDKLKGIPVPAHRVVLAAEMYGRGGFNSPTHFNMTMWGTADAHSKDFDAMRTNEGKVRRPQYHGSSNNRGLNVFFLDGSMALVRPAEGDWRDPDTLGTAVNAGYFYERNQFRHMSEGKLQIP